MGVKRSFMGNYKGHLWGVSMTFMGPQGHLWGAINDVYGENDLANKKNSKSYICRAPQLTIASEKIVQGHLWGAIRTFMGGQ